MRRKKFLKWQTNTGLQLDLKMLDHEEHRLFHCNAMQRIQHTNGTSDYREILLVVTKRHLIVYIVGDHSHSHLDLSLQQQARWSDLRIEESWDIPELLRIHFKADSMNTELEILFPTISGRRQFASCVLQRCLIGKL